MGKRGINPNTIGRYIGMLSMIKPDLGKGVEGLLIVIKDPILLHKAMEEIAANIKQVIEYDHEYGVFSECNSTQQGDGSEGSGERSAGLRGGDARDGEIDPAGSSDERIQSSVLD